ncbi:NACHT domain-containing protein [Kibdelosporangium lantanae]|uniref:NACHT domain-containing protein n=1 Tax=Kibdelosporangium lantanae TaxID=1497396 RepID=A0ABW3M6C7_9PSEU
MVIFDGLDELIDTSKRREMTERIELFCTRYPLTKVLVTSRRVGYEEAALDKAVFEVFELADFSDEKVETYVTNWFTQVDGVDEDTAHQLAESFVEESAAVEDLRRNPLMLALMCIIYRGQNWIPRNRPDMYEHCAKLLFEKWDASRQIYVELKAKAYVDSAIKQLAYWMFTTSEATQGVRESELVKEATTYLEPAFGSRLEAEQAAQEFINFCRGRGWVLTDVGTTAEGEALFAFTHRTFMEYFAAYELTRLNDGPEKVAKALLPHVATAEWEIVAELAVQLSNRHSSAGAERILTILLNSRRHSSRTSQFNIATFAMHCLGFVHTSVPIATRIGSNFIDATIRRAASGEDIQGNRLPIVPEIRDHVEKAICHTLQEAANDADHQRRSIAFEIILELPQLMTGEFLQSPDEGYQRWKRIQFELCTKLRFQILDTEDDFVWFKAWQIGLISTKELILKGPRADDPLSFLFVSYLPRYTTHGWGCLASFASEQLLQGGRWSDDVPITQTDIEWLGRLIDELGMPPWLEFVGDDQPPIRSSQDFLIERIYTDYGWTLFRLLMINIESIAIDAYSLRINPEKEVGTFEMVFIEMAEHRHDYRPISRWLSDAIDALQPDRRDLVVKWLNNEVNFIGPR